MGKHAWVTGRGSRLAYADRYSRLASNDAEISLVEEPADWDAAGVEAERLSRQRDANGRAPAPRTRWRVPAAVTSLVFGAVLSVVLILLMSGRLGTPERAVTLVKSGGHDVAAMQPTRLEISETGSVGAASVAAADAADAESGGDRSGENTGRDADGGGDTSEGAQPAEPPASVVHVAGAVRNPGVVTLPAGSRVHEAIAAAGGAAADAQLSVVNLAAILHDGQQLYVPTRQEVKDGGAAGAALAGHSPAAGIGAGGVAGAGAGAGGVAGGATGTGPNARGAVPVNLNSASAEQLSSLPGVGPVLSQRIIEWRNAHGAFSSLTELDAVAGIGPKMMDALRGLVTL